MGQRRLIAAVVVVVVLGGCGSGADGLPADPAGSRRPSHPLTAELTGSGADSCWFAGQDKGLDLVTSGWSAGDAESLLTTICAGSYWTGPRDGYIDIERLGWPTRARCSTRGFRVPQSGPLTITSAPEGSGRIAISAQRHGRLEILAATGSRGSLRLAPCLARSRMELGGRAISPLPGR